MTKRNRGVALQILVAVLALGGAAAAGWVLRGNDETSHLAVTTHGEWVTIPRRADSIRAYVAYPERKDKAPGMLVIHEIFGLTDWEPTVVDKLAGKGYVAIVPDLLSSRFGKSPADPDSGRKLVAQLNPDSITADLNAAYAYLDSLPAVRSGDIGVIGFCWGGGQSFRYATNNPKLKAAVVCYGPPPDSADLSRITAPVLGVYGEKDARIGATIPRTDSLMKAMGKSYTHHTYPGTGHGFLKPGRQGSDGPQVARAWAEISGFLGKALH